MKMKILMGTGHMMMFGFRTCRIITKPNPIQVIANSSVEDHSPSLFARRYGRAKTDQDHDDGGKKSKSKADRERAPSTADEFNRLAAEKHLKDADQQLADQKISVGNNNESEALGKGAISNEDLDEGPGYRPCS